MSQRLYKIGFSTIKDYMMIWDITSDHGVHGMDRTLNTIHENVLGCWTSLVIMNSGKIDEKRIVKQAVSGYVHHWLVIYCPHNIREWLQMSIFPETGNMDINASIQ